MFLCDIEKTPAGGELCLELLHRNTDSLCRPLKKQLMVLVVHPPGRKTEFSAMFPGNIHDGFPPGEFLPEFLL